MLLFDTDDDEAALLLVVVVVALEVATTGVGLAAFDGGNCVAALRVVDAVDAADVDAVLPAGVVVVVVVVGAFGSSNP